MKERVSTIFIRTVIFFIGIVTLAFCVLMLPRFANAVSIFVPQVAFLKYPFLICMYATMLIFFFALYQAIKLLGYIDNGKVFSELSVKALKNMKLSGITMTVILYLVGMPTIYLVAEVDDAPGLILLGFIIASIPLVVAIFVAVFQRLLEEAVEIKSENDFTVWGECVAIIINIDVMLAKRKMSVTELSEKVGITLANISLLKNGKVKAIRLSTLEKICEALDCQPGDILEYKKSEMPYVKLEEK